MPIETGEPSLFGENGLTGTEGENGLGCRGSDVVTFLIPCAALANRQRNRPLVCFNYPNACANPNPFNAAAPAQNGVNTTPTSLPFTDTLG